MLNPGSRLHSLRGDRKGQYAININKQWRVCVQRKDGHAYNVSMQAIL
ncbi:type II toxin-antitoxin system RelE/ParE family toxin [Candidatus Scalindua japonica]